MARHAMGSADAAWLRMDRPTNLMVINSLLWLREPLDPGAFREVLSERLVDPYPRFRQRVVEPAVGAPAWEDDPFFDIDLHVHRSALPSPGGRAALEALVADRIVVPLDRSKPLWSFELVEGYGDAGVVLARMHHCIADGISLARVLLSLTDGGRDAGFTSPAEPRTRRGGVLGAVTRPAAYAMSATRGIAGALWHEGLDLALHPGHVTDLAAAARDDAAVVARLALTGADADTVLRGELGVAERVAWADPLPLAEVKSVAHANGATVNDVLVAALAGALRSYLAGRESLVDEVRAVVPFNLRPLDEPLPRELGNRFGLVFLGMPVGAPDPRSRLAAVKRSMAAIKDSPEGPIAYGILNAMGSTPHQLESAIVDLFTSKGTAVVTNVPGPSERVRLAGIPVERVLVWAPTSGSVGMSVSILSYAGEVAIGLLTDAGLVPDPGEIVAALGAELEALAGLPDAKVPPGGWDAG